MKLRTVTLVPVLAAAMVAGTWTVASAKGAASPYVIGATGSFTGSIAAASESYLNGMQIAMDAYNARGGDHGHKIQIKTYDDGGQAAQGVVNTRTALTATNVLLVCCGVYSAVTTEEDPLWQQYKTPGISEGAPAGTLTTPGSAGNPYEFVSDLNAGTGEWKQEIAVIAKMAAQKHIKKPKIAIAALATPTGAAAAAAFTKAAQAKGWTVTTTQQVSLTGTDLTAPAAQIASTHPDFVASTAASISEQPFFALLQTDGVTAPIIDYSSGVVASVFQALNMPNLYGLLAWNYPGGTTAAVKKYLRLAAKYHINPAGQLTASGYAAGLMIEGALKKCGASCTRTKLEKALESLKGFTGTGFFAGRLTMSTANHDAFQQANVVHWTGSKGSLVSVFRVSGTTVKTA